MPIPPLPLFPPIPPYSPLFPPIPPLFPYSPPSPPLRDEVNTLEAKFKFLQEGLALLNQIQCKWVYLEPIFARGALPQQQTRFRNVDEEFRRVMTQLNVRAGGGGGAQ